MSERVVVEGERRSTFGVPSASRGGEALRVAGRRGAGVSVNKIALEGPLGFLRVVPCRHGGGKESGGEGAVGFGFVLVQELVQWMVGEQLRWFFSVS